MSGKKKPPSVPTDERTKSILEEIQPQFLEAGAKRMAEEDLQSVVEHADEILAQFASDVALSRHRADAEQMMSMLQDYWQGKYRETPFWMIALATFSFLYVLKPIDIIPDDLPVIGSLDDAIVMALCFGMVRNELISYRLWQGDQAQT